MGSLLLVLLSLGTPMMQAPTIDSVRISVPGAVLAGALHLPAGPGPHAAVLLLPGARDSRFLPGIAEALVENGVAVLDLEKRGVGGSTGHWNRQSFRGRAQDGAAGLDFLKHHGRVDRGRIGVMGHSQGGWIAQMLAADYPGVSFAVLLAAPGQTVRDQILTYERLLHERRGRTPAEVESAVATMRRQLTIAGGVRPVCRTLRLHYICSIIDFDPAPYLQRVTVPVLALFGGVDPMVPPDPNVRLLTAALERAGNENLTVRMFAHANHDFLAARTGLPEEYLELDRTYIPGFLDVIVQWVREITNHRRSVAEPLENTLHLGDLLFLRPYDLLTQLDRLRTAQTGLLTVLYGDRVMRDHGS